MEYPEDIYDIIFKHIQRIKDRVNYSLINKKFYERYNKDLIKYKLELCINKDYREVYNLLEKYKYDNIHLINVLSLTFTFKRYTPFGKSLTLKE